MLDTENYQRRIAFHDLQELSSKLQLDEYWNIIHKDQSLLISHISISPSPKMMLSVLVNDDKSVQAYIEDMPVKKLHDYVIPSHVQDIDTLVVLLNELRKFDRQSKSAMNPVAIIQLVLTFLAVIRNQSFKYLTTLQFISEQLHLMTMRKVEYSTDLVITSFLLCNISPRGYRFLREKKWLIVPICQRSDWSSYRNSAARHLSSIIVPS